MSKRRKSWLSISIPNTSWILWWLLLLWTTILCICTPSAQAIQQKFRRTPDNQTATIGDMVTLACSVDHKAGPLQWTRDGFGLGTDRSLVGFESYRMVGSEEEGDYTLVIDHVSLDDDAVFQCQVGPGGGGLGIRSADAKLTVEVPTGPPEILQGDHLATTEDKELHIECISRGGKPAAEITWVDGGGQEVKEGVETLKEVLEDGKRFNSRSILRFRPRKEHHNKTFTCQAHNRPAKEVKSSGIRLEVKYAPKVSLKILNQRIQEHDNLRVSCKAEANPPEMHFRWFMNDKVIAGDHGTMLVLYNVTRKLHESVLKCEVQNSVGKSEETHTLQVTYGPHFRERPRSAQADLGSSVTLNCDVDGNPQPDVTWFFEATRHVIKKSPNLTVTVTPDTAGRYRCQAAVEGFPVISADASVLLRGPPKIESQKVQFGKEGDTVRLVCMAVAIPKPDKIIWTHFSREVEDNEKDYVIINDPLPDGIRSTLIIQRSTEKDFGPYNCSVVNSYGNHVMEIYLMKQKSGQLVIILTCVIGGVVLIVAVTMITLLCQRKPKKMEDMNESDGDKQKTVHTSDRSSNNDSDLKVEIRTASSLSGGGQDSPHPTWEDTGSDRLKNESFYRYSDYLDPVFQKNDGHNNNGYIPYSDYIRDYEPPNLLRSNHHQNHNNLQQNHHQNHQQNQLKSPNYLVQNMDPRYSATYGNPFLSNLRSNSTPLPPPHHSSNHLNHLNHLEMIPNGHHQPPSGSSKGSPVSSRENHSPTLTSSNSRLLLGNGFRVGNGAVPQVANGGVPAQSQYILSSQPQLKPGTLATHV